MDVPYYIDILVSTFDIDKIITGTISFPRLIFKHNSCIHGFKKNKNVTFQFYFQKPRFSIPALICNSKSIQKS